MYLASQILFLLFLTITKFVSGGNDVNLDSELDDKSPIDRSIIGQASDVSKSCIIKWTKVSGKIFTLQHDDATTTKISLMRTRILFNYGQYIAYPNEDGSFEVEVPPDSYVIEVTHPKYIYEPYRIDISHRGKIRPRRVNYIQPSLIQTIDYPLRFRPKSIHNYFIPRETWRIMDLLFNPMVIMMVVPLLIIGILPKMMSPQETQVTQRDNVQMPEYNVPELSEMMASMFGRAGSTNQAGGSSVAQSITSGGPKHNKAKRR